MSDRKLTKTVQQLFRDLQKLYRSLSKGFVTWLLRTALVMHRRRRAVAGFVLPTTVLLILVVALTAGALSYRAFNSSSRVIGNVQGKAIYNAATPAIDRARAKLDFLFSKDPRLPGGVPAEEFLISMMRNDGTTAINGSTAPAWQPDGTDPYTFPGENRVDVNNDGIANDNAWIYKEDSTGTSIIYSINASTPDDPDLKALELLTMPEATKARGDVGGPFVRTGPLSNTKAVGCPGVGGKIENGWYEDQINTAILRKRFAVNAFVVNNDTAGGKPANFTTLEFLQDRKVDRGNKWGAWFQYDLEIHSGGAFNWNGAMHSEGSMIIGGANTFTAYLISSPDSCVFLPQSNSEISVRDFPADANKGQLFKGVISVGRISNDSTNESARVHVYQGDSYNANPILEATTQWKQSNKPPSQYASDPVSIVAGIQKSRDAADPDNSDVFDQKTNDFVNRFKVDPKSSRPFLDDIYRADNRWGPKARYSDQITVPDNTPVGAEIGGDASLTGDSLSSGPLGLDGYWERRTFANSDFGLGRDNYTGGLRILVGERLELGNPFGWVAPQDRRPTDTAQPNNGRLLPDQDPTQSANAGDGDFEDLKQVNYTTATAETADPDTSDNEGDPLNPPYKYLDPSRAHEAKQRRALRDNLAAVQAAAIYHYKVNDGRYPAACLITTAHPGSPFTLQQSVDFTDTTVAGVTRQFDFFYGKGTNGWEFAPPSEGDLASATSPIGLALRNLANFAGDPEGAYPPSQGTRVRPDPTLTMWGNFSNLRRALQTPYANLSPADKSYLHTASCTLGALGYNINQIQQYNPTASANSTAQTTLANLLIRMMDGNNESGQIEDVLPPAQLATYGYGTSGYDPTKYNPRDYDRVTPEMFLVKLKKYLGDQGVANPETDARYQLASLINQHFQIRRDRTYGFRPSPAANTWNYNPYVVELPFGISKVSLWSSACDPNVFKVGASSTGVSGADINLSQTGAEARRRLALSRLCGTVLPPGSVHDFPGDYNYPSRGVPPTTPGLAVPTPNASVDYLDDLPVLNPAAPPPAPWNAVNAQFANQTNTLNTSAPYNSEVSKRALVMPKFPALYYVFPEFSHGPTGADGTLTGIGIDHRQPEDGSNFANVLAAIHPWEEPYVKRAAQINAGATFQPVGVSTSASSADEDPEYTSPVPITTANLGDPADPNRSITSFSYKALRAFVVPDNIVNLGIGPRPINGWVLPRSNPIATVPNNADNAPPNLIKLGSPGTPAIAAVPFLDRVLFNGREWLPSRVLDIDLEMLRTASSGGGDYWLPASGIVYAFREDSVREDAIARPANGTNPTNASVIGAERDPALFGTNSISIKPVDYYPDPDRRVHGFRLRRGDVLKRPNDVPVDKNIRGITFVTDNLAYILGNFNRHQATPGGTRLEEFTATLPDNPASYNSGNFYDDRTESTRNTTNFADRDNDLWRPTEILADSITLLSDNFCDGSAIDTFMNAGFSTNDKTGGLQNAKSSGSADTVNVYRNSAGTEVGAEVYNDQAQALFGPGCRAQVNPRGTTSFLNQNRPRYDLSNSPQWNWVRENPSDPVNSSVKISRNGNGLIGVYGFTSSSPTLTKPIVPVEYSSTNDTSSPSTTNAYFRPQDDGDQDRSRPMDLAKETTVNAILANGIIPSRTNQPYGGLHNFPRFLEDWENIPLRFAGSFLQLNFSNYATGPYDQDRWEPASTDNAGDEQTDYYAPPVRAWGYDVGLQLAAASPAASRFTTPSSERNEFYNEPAANDPYMNQLCRVLRNNPPAGVNLGNLNCPT